MDIATLTTLAVTALTTFFAGAADSAAHKAGEAVYEQGKHIYEAIKARFSTEADGGKASQALGRLGNQPALEALQRLQQQKRWFSLPHLGLSEDIDAAIAEVSEHLQQGQEGQC